MFSHPTVFVCSSVEMMGHPDLVTEYDIHLMDPLLPQKVVDELLSKYVQTFTVSPANTHSVIAATYSMVALVRYTTLSLCVSTQR